MSIDTSSIDTLHLTGFRAKKVVVYKLNSVTIYLPYSLYLKDQTTFWKAHRSDIKYVKNYKPGGEYLSPELAKNWLDFDSTYHDLKKQAKKNDTIFITPKRLYNSEQPIENNFIAQQIDKNKCTIFVDGKIQSWIIRLKCSWYKHSRAAWYGRRYFTLEFKNYFLSATDVVS